MSSPTSESGYAELGAEIKAARERAGLTQRELAERTSISEVHLCSVEKGKSQVSLETLRQLAFSSGCHVKISLVPGTRAWAGAKRKAGDAT